MESRSAKIKLLPFSASADHDNVESRTTKRVTSNDTDDEFDPEDVEQWERLALGVPKKMRATTNNHSYEIESVSDDDDDDDNDKDLLSAENLSDNEDKFSVEDKLSVEDKFSADYLSEDEDKFSADYLSEDSSVEDKFSVDKFSVEVEDKFSVEDKLSADDSEQAVRFENLKKEEKYQHYFDQYFNANDDDIYLRDFPKIVPLGGSSPEEDLLRALQSEYYLDMYYRLQNVDLSKAFDLALERGNQNLVDQVQQLRAGDNCWWVAKDFDQKVNEIGIEYVHEFQDDPDKLLFYLDCLNADKMHEYLQKLPKEALLSLTTGSDERWDRVEIAIFDMVEDEEKVLSYIAKAIDENKWDKLVKFIDRLKWWEVDDGIFESKLTEMLVQENVIKNIVTTEVLPPSVVYAAMYFIDDAQTFTDTYKAKINEWILKDDKDDFKIYPLLFLKLVKLGILSPYEAYGTYGDDHSILEWLLEIRRPFPDVEKLIIISEIYNLTVDTKVDISRITIEAIRDLQLRDAFERGLLERKARLANKQMVERADRNTGERYPMLNIDMWRHIMLRSKISKFCDTNEIAVGPPYEYEKNSITKLLGIPPQVMAEFDDNFDNYHAPQGIAELDDIYHDQLYRDQLCQFFVDVFTLGPKWSPEVQARVEERKGIRDVMQQTKTLIANRKRLNLPPIQELEDTLLELQNVYLLGNRGRA